LYGLILMDCQMPVMDGYQAAKKIREFLHQNKQIQPYMVACTGNVEESQIKRAWSSKFDEVVAKPVTVQIITTILT
jgi:CheY-like chemotaxis protein